MSTDYRRNFGRWRRPSRRFAFVDVKEMRDGGVQGKGNFIEPAGGHSTRSILVLLELLKHDIQPAREFLLTEPDLLSLASNAFADSHVKIAACHD